MNVALIALLGLTIVGFLILLDRRDKRAHEERQAHRLQVMNLCQRLQAPEQAVIEHVSHVSDGPTYRNPWDVEQERLINLVEGGG